MSPVTCIPRPRKRIYIPASKADIITGRIYNLVQYCARQNCNVIGPGIPKWDIMIDDEVWVGIEILPRMPGDDYQDDDEKEEEEEKERQQEWIMGLDPRRIKSMEREMQAVVNWVSERIGKVNVWENPDVEK